MDDEQRLIEISGGNIEQAIQTGLRELGKEREEVEIEILDEGSSGLLGIGKREAVVRLSVVSEESAELEPTSRFFEEEMSDSTKTPVKEVPEESPAERLADADEEHLLVDRIETLLSKMAIEAEINTRTTEPDELTGETRTVVDIHGDDMGILIGPRGETLNALQYLTRLMIGHQTRQRPTFIIDVEGYRTRREQALARLAERMANKVISRNKPISLEPMPPNERRIIHITLRDDQRVYTESSGEGKHRKVRIYPSS